MFKPQNPHYLRQWASTEIILTPGDINFSLCIYSDLEIMIATILAQTKQTEFKKIYCVCPQYFDKNKGLMDVQATITGTCFNGETPYNTAVRELMEEAGVCGHCVYFGSNTNISGKKEVSNFCCQIDENTRMCDTPQEFKPGQDNRRKKIQILAYGNIDILLQKFSATITPPPASDNIPSDQGEYLCGIKLISLEDVITYYNQKFQTASKISTLVSQIQTVKDKVAKEEKFT